MITDVIEQLIGFKDLTEDEARSVMEEIMTGQSTDAQVAAFLTALRMKGETADEMVGFARGMRQKAASLWEGEGPEVVDTCGTGGDRSGTFNISTAAAFVAEYGFVGFLTFHDHDTFAFAVFEMNVG